MRILAWPAISDNPYIADLYRQIAELDPSIEIHNFDVARAWRDSADVVHVHWPEAAAQAPSLIHSLAKSSMVLLGLASLRLRHGAVVWTCHNLKGHDQVHPRLERVVIRLFQPMVDGVIHLTEESREGFSQLGRLPGTPDAVIPHGVSKIEAGDCADRSSAREALGLDQDLPVMAFVGMIRRYKNVPALIKAFGEMEQEAQLVVAGRSTDRRLATEIEEAAQNLPDVMLDPRWLADEEVACRILAADVVVLPYLDVHNSGVAVLSASLGRPVVINPAGSIGGFAASVGEEWVYPLTEPLTGTELDTIVEWARQERLNPPNLEAFDPQMAAALTVEFYRRLTAA